MSRALRIADTSASNTFDDLDEEEEHIYEKILYRDRLSVLLYFTEAPVARRCVKLEQLIADIKSLGFSVSEPTLI